MSRIGETIRLRSGEVGEIVAEHADFYVLNAKVAGIEQSIQTSKPFVEDQLEESR